jgi:hypothetical protein
MDKMFEPIGEKIYQIIFSFGEKKKEKIDVEVEREIGLLCDELSERRDKMKKCIESILKCFKPKDIYLVHDRKELCELYAKIRQDKDKKQKQLYHPELQLDMYLYHQLNDRDVAFAVSRVKTPKSFLDKIIKKKIFGISEAIERDKRNFYKFYVTIVCRDEAERKVIAKKAKELGISNVVCWKDYARERNEKKEKNNQNRPKTSLIPLILKTGEYEIVTSQEEVRFFNPAENLEQILSSYVEDVKHKKILSEMAIKDLGGIAFVLKAEFDSKDFRQKCEAIVRKFSGYEVKKSENKSSKDGYRAYHYVFDCGMPEMLEVRFADVNCWWENEFGKAYASRYKHHSTSAKIPKPYLPIVQKIYDLFGTKL